MPLRAFLLLPWLMLQAVTPTPAEIAADAGEQGYYVQPGSESVDNKVLADLVKRMSQQGIRYLPVLIADDLDLGPTVLADGILDVLDSGTVVVLTPSEFGYASVDYDANSRLFDEAARQLADAGSAEEAFVRFAEVLALGIGGQIPGGEDVNQPVPLDSGGGGGFPWLLLLLVAGLVGVVVVAVRGSTRAETRRRSQDLEEARGEIKKQLDAVANEILEDADASGLSDNQQAKDLFEAASKTFQDAMDVFEKSRSLKDLEVIAAALDKARWQLQASQALREGKPLPAEPMQQMGRVATCFFDPTHRPASEDAVLQTSAGDKAVKVCAQCAERLGRGEQPRPRMINVGGRQVPSPMAPRSYGGGGFDWLTGMFDLVLGSLRMGAPTGWGLPGPFSVPRSRESRREVRYQHVPPPRLPSPGRVRGGGLRGGGGIRGGFRRR